MLPTYTQHISGPTWRPRRQTRRQWQREREKGTREHSRASPKARVEVLLGQLEEGLHRKARIGVVHGGGELRAGEEVPLDGGKGGVDGGRISCVSGDAVGGAAGGADLVDDGLVRGGRAGEQDDGVGPCEAEGGGGAGAGGAADRRRGDGPTGRGCDDEL